MKDAEIPKIAKALSYPQEFALTEGLWEGEKYRDEHHKTRILPAYCIISLRRVREVTTASLQRKGLMAPAWPYYRLTGDGVKVARYLFEHDDEGTTVEERYANWKKERAAHVEEEDGESKRVAHLWRGIKTSDGKALGPVIREMQGYGNVRLTFADLDSIGKQIEKLR